jgi:hypothetical protein
MELYAERFIEEFERPLIQPHLSRRPIQSRVRFKPGRARFDVLLPEFELAPRVHLVAVDGVHHLVELRADGDVAGGERLPDLPPTCTKPLGGRSLPIQSRDERGRWQVGLLLLSTGGGSGNILRSVKALFEQDLAVTEKPIPMRGTTASRGGDAFLDTNEFSLTDVPPEERLLIGPRTTGRLGARHNPDVAEALAESRARWKRC